MGDMRGDLGTQWTVTMVTRYNGSRPLAIQQQSVTCNQT